MLAVKHMTVHKMARTACWLFPMISLQSEISGVQETDDMGDRKHSDPRSSSEDCLPIVAPKTRSGYKSCDSSVLLGLGLASSFSPSPTCVPALPAAKELG